MENMVDNTGNIFKAISDFVNNLGREFGPGQRSLALYVRLLEHTNFITHTDSVNKHVTTFTKFYKANKDAIFEKNFDKFEMTVITYSPKVRINLTEIFKLASSEVQENIWKHLIGIGYLIDPTERNKEMLMKSLETSGAMGGDMGEMFKGIFSMIDDMGPGEQDPMAMVSNIMKSDMMKNLFQGMNGGEGEELDLSKMMGPLMGMLGGLSMKDKATDHPTIEVIPDSKTDV